MQQDPVCALLWRGPEEHGHTSLLVEKQVGLPPTPFNYLTSLFNQEGAEMDINNKKATMDL